MEQQLFDIVIEKDEITWKDIIYDLVKSEQMNPWDVDIGKLDPEIGAIGLEILHDPKERVGARIRGN